MKVFDLQCSLGHKFEGWFASEESFQDQLARQMVVCPFCSDTQITKLVTVPQLQRKSNQKISKSSVMASNQEPSLHGTNDTIASASRLMPDQLKQLQAKIVEHVLENTEDVGDEFVEEARKMHYGETPERGIRGQASIEDAQELQNEGIDIVALPFSSHSKKNLQ